MRRLGCHNYRLSRSSLPSNSQRTSYFILLEGSGLGVIGAGIELSKLLDDVAVAGGFELNLGAGVELDKSKLALVVHCDGGDLIQGNGPGDRSSACASSIAFISISPKKVKQCRR